MIRKRRWKNFQKNSQPKEKNNLPDQTISQLTNFKQRRFNSKKTNNRQNKKPLGVKRVPSFEPMSVSGSETEPEQEKKKQTQTKAKIGKGRNNSCCNSNSNSHEIQSSKIFNRRNNKSSLFPSKKLFPNNSGIRTQKPNLQLSNGSLQNNSFNQPNKFGNKKDLDLVPNSKNSTKMIKKTIFVNDGESGFSIPISVYVEPTIEEINEQKRREEQEKKEQFYGVLVPYVSQNEFVDRYIENTNIQEEQQEGIEEEDQEEEEEIY
ncbi:hypothetical protein M0813_10974 [Anaeramoeba flamelloides]|uniref:Uncharacterized protein n=1 Tax=Anaeramoeba flamelloides TaxID=1746091 RepID=A0ABQ8X1E7_9EUKA|nr:hypothetical protein M0813_10974 [Anaeramoeba flamelloides]